MPGAVTVYSAVDGESIYTSLQGNGEHDEGGRRSQLIKTIRVSRINSETAQPEDPQ
jgi:hypothetical protein